MLLKSSEELQVKYLLIAIFSMAIYGADVVRVGLFEAKPFSYRDKKGDLQGAIYTLAKKIEKESGLKFEYYLQPYQRSVKDLESGGIDMLIAYPSKSYENRFKSIGSTLGNTNYIISNIGSGIDDLDSLTLRKVAVIRGAKYLDEFDTSKKIKFIKVKSYEQSITLLMRGRVDAVVMSSAAFLYHCYARGLDPDFAFKRFVLNEQKNWIHISKDLPAGILNKIKNANERYLRLSGHRNLGDILIENHLKKQSP